MRGDPGSGAGGSEGPVGPIEPVPGAASGSFSGDGVWTNPFVGGDPAASGGGGQAAPNEAAPPEPVRAAVVMPLADVERVADAFAVAGIHLDLVPVEGVGLVAVLGSMLEPAAQAQVQMMSRTLRRVPITLLLATDEQALAQAWWSGARQGDPKAGLLLANWPDEVLALLLGRLSPSDVPGTASSAGRGRWKALARGLRKRPR